MNPLKLTCPQCACEMTLNPRRMLVRVDAGTATSGEVLFTCLGCRRTEAVILDVTSVAHLVTSGVTYLSLSEPTLAHPGPRPPGPPLTHDDLLDMHAALARDDTWPEELSGLGC